MIGRVFRLVRTPVTLLILLGVLAYGAWWGYRNVLQPIPATPPAPCVQQPVRGGELRSTQVTVSVFNGGLRKGLAADVGRSLRSKGFKVLKTANTNEKIGRTVIVGSGVKNPEVLLVKGFFRRATVRADKRVDRTVDVLVGNDYAGFNKKAKTTRAVRGRTVCLPPQNPTPSAAAGLVLTVAPTAAHRDPGTRRRAAAGPVARVFAEVAPAGQPTAASQRPQPLLGVDP